MRDEMIVKFNSSKKSLQTAHSDLSSTQSTKVNIKIIKHKNQIKTLSIKKIKNELIYAKKESSTSKLKSNTQNVANNNDILLDPNHTHFILVDDGSEGAFGKEIGFRAHLEAELRKGRSLNYYEQKRKRRRHFTENSENKLSEDENFMNEDIEYQKLNSIPMVLIVVQGGPNTLLTSIYY